jgi:septation ring formation regulator EzrA
MSKELFICVNTSFVETCITYYSNDQVTSNMGAVKAISKQNQEKTKQIKDAFSRVHKDILKTANSFSEVASKLFEDFKEY